MQELAVDEEPQGELAPVAEVKKLELPALGEYLSENELELLSALSNINPTPNPFYNQDKFNLWELIKFILGIVLVPVKILLITFHMLILWPLTVLATSCFCCFNEEKSPNFFQRFIGQLSGRSFSRTVLLAAGVWRVKVIGKYKAVSTSVAPVLVAAPHSSFLDAFAVGAVVGVAGGFSKKSVRSIPFIGATAVLGRMVFIDRASPEARHASLEKYQRRVARALGNSQQKNADLEMEVKEEKLEPYNVRFLAFPEGTCTNRKSLIDFRFGAFSAGAPCQLMVLHWGKQGFDTTWPKAGSNRMWLVWRMFTQIYTSLTLEFSDVIVPTEEEKERPELMARRVRNLASEMLKIPVTQYNYKDGFLAQHAKKVGLNPDKTLDFAVEEFNTAAQALKKDDGAEEDTKFTFPAAKSILNRYAVCCLRNGEGLDLVGFAKYFHLPVKGTVAKQLFSPLLAAFNRSQEKSLRFRDVYVLMSFFRSCAERDGLTVGEVEAGLWSLDADLAKRFSEVVNNNQSGEKFLKDNPEVLFLWARIVECGTQGEAQPPDEAAPVPETSSDMPSI